jgi:menaquinone-specific isochorismate synthase
MNNIAAGYKVYNIQETIKLMSTKIKDALGYSDKPLYQDQKIIRLTAQVPDQPLLPWLKIQNFSLKTYWSDRENRFEVAGVGAADYIGDTSGYGYRRLFDRLHNYLDQSDPDVRYYGGFKFAPNQTSHDSWKRFGRYYFVLPRFELVRSRDKTLFVCNLHANEDDHTAIMTQLEAITFKTDGIDNGIPKIISEKNFPGKSRWKANVQSALAAFETHRYEKIVLARKRALEFSDNLNHFTILQKLRDKASNSYKFCFQPEDNLAFIGASPELLYYREGRKLQSEAIAGTRTRGQTSREDQGFGEELLGSEKDLREHRYVVDSVKDAFVSLTPPSLNGNNMSVSLLKLARVQHLIARFDIKLKDSVSDAELIETLHPTAAVGGYPRDKAVEEIDRLEGFNRGWYAAPVGWVKQDAAKFVVAIRCGLVKNNCLSLYSGAGIVRGSVPDNEWDEMNNKIDMFLSVLT